jgi:peptidoglycan pentaglycine glycine transferase (the first glycine)
MNPAEWNQTIEGLPGASFLQTEEWARIKEPVGWRSEQIIWPVSAGRIRAAAMMLYRSPSRLPVSIAYVPRGPLLDWTDAGVYSSFLSELIAKARQHRAIFIKIDPALTTGTGIPGTQDDRPDTIGIGVQQYLKANGWRFSSDQIQFRNTIEIDLTASEEEILMRMHPKTRYNIRLAERRGVDVIEARREDWPSIYHLYMETADRDGFIIRPWEYYQRVWQILSEGRMATCLKAEIDGELIGAIWVIGFGKKSHYLYGMSGLKHREDMPNHLLQWRAIQMARSQGREIYDMWGAPDEFTGDDRLSGVYRFKRGFGGEVVRTLGAWDYPIRPTTYRLYTSLLPRVLDVMRRRNRSNTRRYLES